MQAIIGHRPHFPCAGSPVHHYVMRPLPPCLAAVTDQRCNCRLASQPALGQAFAQDRCRGGPSSLTTRATTIPPLQRGSHALPPLPCWTRRSAPLGASDQAAPVAAIIVAGASMTSPVVGALFVEEESPIPPS